jgi:hypothetical protein
MPDLDSISTLPTPGPAVDITTVNFRAEAFTGGGEPPGRRRWTATLPMRTALVAVAAVWLLGCAWSFQEQSEFAAANGFVFPHLLPLVIDGFAVSMAGVSWAASLDARPAISARLATVIAVAGSSASNGVWAWLRTHHDSVTVALGVAVPVAANVAFEVLLGELRRQVQRRRGLPAPVAIPYPRLIRFALAPWTTFRTWRTLVLDLTADHLTASALTATESRHAPILTSRPAPGPISQAAHAAPPVATASPLTPAPPLSAPVGRPGPAKPGATTATVADQPAESLPGDGSARPRKQSRPPAPAPVAAAASPTSAPVAPAVRQPAAGKPAAPKPGRRPRELSAISIAAAAERTSRPGTRVATLAQHLSTADHPDQITGEQVAELLGVPITPRTGRRLLGQARELLDRESATADGHEHRLAVVASH